MRRALVVGGANGIGLAIATQLAESPACEKVYIVDKAEVTEDYMNGKFECFKLDLTCADYSFFDRFDDIDTLMITAGFGRLALFRDIAEEQIDQYFAVNTLPAIHLIKRFYAKLESSADFRCGVMVSIAGFMSSPFFSLYAATKAALKVLIESINVELEKAGTTNRILNVSPGSIKGTSFAAGKTDLSQLRPLAAEIIEHLESKDDLFIPQYDEVYREVLGRYHDDFRAEGRHSYDYKMRSGRMNTHNTRCVQKE